MNRKALLWFLVIAFGIAWVLFTAPIAFKNNQTVYSIVMQVCFVLAMWAPGIAAIIVTLSLEKKPIKSLRMNTLGPIRYYVAALLFPPIVAFMTLGVTLLIGTGTFDPDMTMMRDAISKAPPGTALPPVDLLMAVQLVSSLLITPFFNMIFALGEEIGWRGFLLLKLMPLGQWKAIIISGMIWGFWHAPTTLIHGYNFPQHQYLGVFVMIGGCTLLGVILSWLYLNTRSPWSAALGHGAVNASYGLPLFFLKPGFDTAMGGNALGIAGWIPMVIIIAWLVWTKRLPVSIAQSNPNLPAENTLN